MKKFIALLLCLLFTATITAGCAGKKEESTTETSNETANEATAETTTETDDSVATATDSEPLKIALCVSGAVNDMGWNQVAYEGAQQAAEKFGCEIAYTENLAPADIAAAFTDYASSGYDIIIGHGYEFGDPAAEVGALYPDAKFIVIEGEVSADNVASYQLSCNEAAYLNGMLAASITKSGKIGIIGPIQGSSLVKIVNGFEDGAKSVNPNVEVQTAWTGSFTDTALAKEAATAMIESGVDIIEHCANECGTGAINAAAEAGIYAIGDSYDQHELAPETILTSSIYNVPILVVQAVEDVVNGEFVGEITSSGMADGVVELAPYYDMESVIPEEVRTLIANKAEEIKSGAFEVPLDTTIRQ